MDVDGENEDSSQKNLAKENANSAFSGPWFVLSQISKITRIVLSASYLVACTETAPEFEDIGNNNYAKPVLEQNIYLISDLTSNSPAISGTCDDNSVSIGMKPEGNSTYDDVQTNTLDSSSDLKCDDGKFSLVISEAGTYMGFTLSVSAQKTLSIKTTGFSGDSAEADVMIRYLPTIPVIDIVDISSSLTEGGSASLRLSITPRAEFGAQLSYLSADQSAEASSDYTTATGLVSFSSGDDYFDVVIPITTDALFEAEELFSVSLVGVVGANLGIGQYTVTIPANGTPPGITVFGDSQLEGDPLSFTVSLTEVSGVETVFNWSLFGGTAVGGTDYPAAGGSASIAAGSLTTSIEIVSIEDSHFETDETFLLSLDTVLNASVGVIGTDDLTTGTIRNDDSQVNLFLTAPTPTNEGGDLVFMVSVSSTSVFNVTYDFNSFDGTATTADSDYTSVSSTATLLAGNLTQSITISTGNDAIYESNETMTLSLSSVVGALVANPGTDDVQSATIQNDDSPPSLYVFDTTMNEGETSIMVVSLSTVSGADAVFEWQTYNGSALSGSSDYTAITNTLVTIPSGSLTTGVVQVAALSDSMDEYVETFTVSLSVQSDVIITTPGVDDLATVTVIDIDSAPDIFIADISMTEPDTISYVVSLSAVSGKDVVFDYSSVDTGSASGGGIDYNNFSSSSVTIGAGAGAVTLDDGNSVDDLLSEGTENYQITISSHTNSGVGKIGATVTVYDNEVTPSIFVTDSAVTEGATFEFIVSLSGASASPVTFDFNSYNGSATTTDSDYSSHSRGYTIGAGELQLTLAINTGSDTKFEINETMSVTISNVSASVIIASPGSDDSATGTINNDDLAPLLYIDDLTFSEDTTGDFLVSLSEVSALDAVLSWQTIDNYEATAGVDYTTASGTATIAAGSLALSIPVMTLPMDALDESIERFTLSLAVISGAGTGNLLGLGSILDNDGAPNLYIADLTVVEGETSHLTISLAASSGLDVEFDLTSYNTGSANSGTDYNAIATTRLTIPSGILTLGIQIISLEDLSFEADEFFDVSLSNITNAGIGDDQGLVTIQEDDAQPVLSVYPVSLTEGSTLEFLVSLSAASDVVSSFSWQSYDGSGGAYLNATTADSDYLFTSGSGTIVPGGQQFTIPVVSTHDTKLESDESFEISLSSLGNVSVVTAGVTDRASGIILNNDDNPDIFIDDLSLNEGMTLSVMVSLSEVSGLETIFTWTTYDGAPASLSAKQAEGDYIQVSGMVVTIPAGTLSISSVEATALADAIDEFDENYMISLSALIRADVGDDKSIVTLVDQNGSPALFISDISIDEGDLGIMTVSLDAPSGRNIWFSYETVDNSAMASDYTQIPIATGTILAGTTTLAVNLATTEDVIAEGAENFYVSLSAPSYSTIVDDIGLVTINDDEGILSIFVSDSTVTEGETFGFIVSLSGISASEVTFDFASFDGLAAVADSDYSAHSSNYTLGAGELQMTVAINTADDTKFEANETMSVTISNVSASVTILSAGTDDSATGTINNDDSAPLLYIENLSFAESTTGEFLVSLSEVSGFDAVFTWATFDGSATTGGLDYVGVSSTQVTIPSGSLTVSDVQVSALSDSIDENNENFSITLAVVSGAGIGDLDSVGTIIDQNNPPSIFIGDATGSEGAILAFIVSLDVVSGLDVDFSYQSFDGTALIGDGDYSALSGGATIPAFQGQITLSLITTNDTKYEANEILNVSLSSVNNATVSLVGTDDFATGTINNDDNAPQLFISNSTVNEGDTLVFVVSISQVSAIDVSFDYQNFDGTASIADGDYGGVGGTLTVASASLIRSITVVSNEDTRLENSEDFTLSLSNISGATIVAAGTDDVATGTINNDDVAPLIYIDDLAYNEGTTGLHTVSLSEASSLDSVFSFVLIDNETVGADYNVLTSGTVTLAGGVTLTSIDIDGLADGFDENNETYFISLTSVSGLQDGDLEATGTINDMDSPPDLFIGDVAFLEGDIAVATVSISAMSGLDVGFTYQSFDTTSATGGGADYNDIVSTTATIPAGSLTYSFNMTSVEDFINEFDETFNVSLTGISNAGHGDTSATMTILNDDGLPQLSIFPSGGDEGTTIFFTVSLTSVSGLDVTFDYESQTIVGQAIDGSDFTGVSTTQATITASNLTIGIPIIALSDAPLNENAETFMVSISNPANATIIGATATGTINDVDSMPEVFIDDPVTVNEGETFSFTITLSKISGRDLWFDWQTVDGTALQGSGDYNQVSSTALTIPAGVGTVSVDVVALTDAPLNEPTENLLVTLTGLTNVIVGDVVASGDIADIDADPLIYIDDLTAIEGETSDLIVSLSAVSAIPVTASLAYADGTATGANLDYTVLLTSVSVPAMTRVITLSAFSDEDALNEGTEFFLMTLSSMSDAQVGDVSAQFNITDDDPQPSVYISDATAVTEGAVAEFIVSLSWISGLDVDFTYNSTDDTALSPDDFTALVSNTVTIPAGSLQTTISVVTIDDAKDDSANSEYFNVTLTGVTNGTMGVSSGQGQIDDNDAPPTIYISDASGNEGETVVFEITLSGHSENNVDFDFRTLNATAIASGDYGSHSISGAQISAGNITYSFGITLATDNIYESLETFQVTISSTTATLVGSDLSGLGSIVDVTGVPSLYTMDASSVTEGVTSEFVVTLNHFSDTDVTFVWETLNGLAIFGQDYSQVTSMAATIASMNSSVTLFVATNNDVLGESTENFQVSLSGFSANVSGVDVIGDGDILDDDGGLSIKVYGDTQVEGFDLVFQVSASSASASNVSFTLDTYDNLATLADSDYTGVSGLVGTIPAGELVFLLTIATGVDAKYEMNEDFSLSLSSPIGAIALGGDRFATGTISNDDMIPELYIADAVAVTEGETSEFIVSLASETAVDVTFDWQIFDGTATTSDNDFSALTLSSSVTMSAGISRVTIAIASTQDFQFENDENFFVSLSNVNAAGNLVDALGVATITNDDSLEVSFDDSGDSLPEYGRPAVHQFLAVGGGYGHSCALHADGRAFCWGKNTMGELGNGVGSGNSNSPVSVVAGESPGTFKQISGAYDAITCAVGSDDRAYCWGKGALGATGHGSDMANKDVPTLVSLGAGPEKYLHIEGGGSHSCGLGIDRKIYCWGSTSWALGIGLVAGDYTPKAVSLGAGPSTYKAVDAHSLSSCGLGLDDKIYCWGLVAGSSIPVQMSDGAGPGTYKHMSVGSSPCAIGTDDRVYCFGDNNYGQLGDGSNSDSTAPVALASGSGPVTYKTVYSGHEASCGLGTDDKLYCWGRGNAGKLGNGDFSHHNTPVAVNFGDSPGTFHSIFMGGNQTCGLAIDNKMYCWGNGTYGQIGNGSFSNHSFPRAVIDGENIGGEYQIFSPYFHLDIVLSSWYASDITVPFTVLGSSSSGVDHSVASGTMTVSAARIRLATPSEIINDLIVEGDETLVVSLGSPSVGALGTFSTYTITIVDDDQAIDLSIADASPVTEGQTSEFIVSLASAAVTDVTFDWQTVDGTATATDSDYSAVTLSGTIATGEMQVTLAVASIQDANIESDESFNVSLSHVSANANVIDDQAVGIITNDDQVTIVSVGVPASTLYNYGSALNFTVSFSGEVTVVMGTPPAIQLNFNSGGPGFAQYSSGSPGYELTFTYNVDTDDHDSDGIQFHALNPFIELNGSSIVAGTGDVTLAVSSAPSVNGVTLDGVAPLLEIDHTSLVAQADPTNSTQVTFSYRFSEDLMPSSIDVSDFVVYGTATSTIAGIITVTPDRDYKLVVVPGNDGLVQVSITAGSVEDLAGNPLGTVTLSDNSVTYDNTGPSIVSVNPPSPAIYTSGNFDIQFGFDDMVSVSASNSSVSISIDGVAEEFGYLSGTGTTLLTYRYVISGGDEDYGAVLAGNSIASGGDTFTDTIGNEASLDFLAPDLSAITIDARPPTILGWGVPADGSYTTGQYLNFTVTFSEPVSVPGTKLIAFDLDSGSQQANYYSGSGTSTIVFRYTVGGGDSDVNGITLPSSFIAGAGSIVDRAGNPPASLNLDVKDTSGILVGSAPVLYLSGTGGSTFGGVTITSCGGGGDSCDFSNPFVLTMSATFSHVSLVNGAALVADVDTDGLADAGDGMLEFSVLDTLDIHSGTVISMSGRGFNKGFGSGVSGGDTQESGGGGHAGVGGESKNDFSGGGTYGSITYPVDMGSGSGALSGGYGARGGGVIKIQVGQLAKINGEILANGEGGNGDLTSASGGGAGGSIIIETVTLSGSGIISANGGQGYWNATRHGGGGSGGRIAIYYEEMSGGTELDTTFPLNVGALVLRAYGGNVSGGVKENVGGAGTMFYDDIDDGKEGFLLLDNYGIETNNATPIESNLEVDLFAVGSQAYLDISSNITLKTQNYSIDSMSYLKLSGTLDSVTIHQKIDYDWTWDGGKISGVIPGGDLTIATAKTMTFTDYTLSLSSFYLEGTGMLTSEDNSGSTFYRVDIDAASITIAPSAIIDVDEKGNPGGIPTLNGAPANLIGSYNKAAAGGSYGGYGGDGTQGVSNKTNYGEILGDLTLGAGGGDASSAKGGAGGGYVRLKSSGTIDIRGANISAMGEAGELETIGETNIGGGGSGGAIEIIALNISVNGSTNINLEGGSGSSNSNIRSGSGGGGRGYFQYSTTTSELFTQVNSSGGPSAGYPQHSGAPGTLVFNDDGYLALNIDTNWKDTEAETPLYSEKVQTITLDEMNLKSGSNPVIPVGNKLNLSPSSLGVSDSGPYESSLIIEGEWENTISGITMHTVIRNPAPTALNPSAGGIEIDQGGILEIGHNSLIDWSGVSLFEIQNGGLLTHTKNPTSALENVINMKLNNVIIYSTGSISVTGKGHAPVHGPHPGESTFHSFYYAGGGGHGGKGGNSADGYYLGGSAYGNLFTPSLAGSGGGGRFTSSPPLINSNTGYGGGVVLLDIGGNFTFGGSIEADGIGSDATNGYGGGAGGSVSISVAGTFTGNSGNVQARGGNVTGGTSYAGGGGGGRIYLVPGFPSAGTGINASAYGGSSGFGESGENGTVYRGPAVVDFITPSSPLSEASPTPSPIWVKLSHEMPMDTTVLFQTHLDVAASPNNYAEASDFYFQQMEITIPKGQINGAITVLTIDDYVWEGGSYQDTFDLTISAVDAQLTEGMSSAHRITITDNEPNVGIHFFDGSVTEGESVNLVVSLSHPSEAPISLNLATGTGTTQGSDFTLISPPSVNLIPSPTTDLTFPVTVAATAADGDDFGEYFTVNLSNNASPTFLNFDESTSTVFIIDNNGTTRDVYLLDGTVIEGRVANVVVTVGASASGGGPISGVISVSGGSATVADYDPSFSGGFTVPMTAGQHSAVIQIPIYSDNFIENENLIVNFYSGPSGADLNAVKTTATIDIIDAPEVRFTTASTLASEGSVGSYNIDILPSANSAMDIQVTAIPLDAVSGSDYNLIQGNIQVAPGDSSVMVGVLFPENDLFEFPESFVLSISSVTNAYIGSISVMTVTITDNDSLEVKPQFPINGRRWNDYVKNDSGSNRLHTASDAACDADADRGTGGYANCIHGGEAKVVRTGLASCSDLTLEDTKGAFTWHCDDSGIYVDFYSYQLNDSIGLNDLIIDGATPSLSAMAVSLTRATDSAFGVSSLTGWWGNPVMQITNKGTPNENCVDFDIDGGIYYTNSIRSCSSVIRADRVAVVAKGTGYLQKNSSDSTKFCDGSNSAKYCMLSADNKDFLWIEADIEAVNTRASVPNETRRSQVGLSLENSNFSVVRNSNIVGALDHNMHLINSSNLLIRNSNFSDQSEAAAPNSNVEIESTEYSNFVGLKISNSQRVGMNINLSGKNVFNQLLITGSEENGLFLQTNLSQRNTFKELTVINSLKDGIHLMNADNNSFFNGVIVNSGESGLNLSGTANYNEFTNLSIYRTENDAGLGKKIKIGSVTDNKFFGEVKIDSATGLCQIAGGTPGITASCFEANNSDFNLSASLDLSGSFEGVVSSDSSNPQGGGLPTVAYSVINSFSSWINFENDLRVWGRVGGYSSTLPLGVCGRTGISENCDMYDWNLTDTDIELEFGTPTVSGGVACPIQFNGGSANRALLTQDQMPSPNQFFVQAEEISGDGIGDDDTLCESNEACIQVMNLGMDQDAEDRIFGETCSFSDGSISNVKFHSLARWDVFDNLQVGNGWALSDGDTGGTLGSSATNIRSKSGHSSGKYYVEFVVTLVGFSTNTFGLGLAEGDMDKNTDPAGESDTLLFYDSGQVYDESSTPNHFGLPTDYNFRSPGSVVGLVIDLDSNPTRVWISVNGLYLNSGGTLWNSSTPQLGQYRDINNSSDLHIVFSGNTFGSGTTVKARFDPKNHSYSPPAGYKAGWPEK